MKLLTRKEEECIILGKGIEIRVISIKGGKVKLGIKAPKDIPVHRMEVQDAIEKGLLPRDYEPNNETDIKSKNLDDDVRDTTDSGDYKPGNPIKYHHIMSQIFNLSNLSESYDSHLGGYLRE